MTRSAYDTDLPKNPANYPPLTPLCFLARAAAVFPHRTAIVHGNAALYLCAILRPRAPACLGPGAAGIGAGDTVSVMLPNTPPMLEAHYGVPMTGAVLHSINTRLDAAIIAFMLDHAETKVLITDTEFSRP